MIGIDTNVLVRYIAQDDVSQSKLATKFIEQQCSSKDPGFVSIVTLIELVWVCETCYDASKSDVVSMVNNILSAKQLLVQDAETVWKALRLFEQGKADFADHLVERISKDHGCDSIVTFDKTASKAGMTLLV